MRFSESAMELLTVKETARLLRVSPITIRRYIASGRLPAERVGRGIRVRRKAIEGFVTPIAPTEQRVNDEDEIPTVLETLGISVGTLRTGQPTIIAEHKDEYLADAFSDLHDDGGASDSDDLLGKPFTMDDSLWRIFGIGESIDPTEVAENKHKYLANAYLSDEE
jgi:excisionase family DNA binding protein